MADGERGLVRTIGRWSLVALMVNSILGAGVFGLPSVLAARIGAWSVLACLVSAAGILIVAACIAEVSSRFDETGGLYLYGRAAFGRFAGLAIAWLTWLMRVVAPAAGADLFATYTAQFFPALQARWAEVAVLAVLIGHLAFFNYIGVKFGNRVSNAFTIVKTSFLLLFVLAGLAALWLRPEVRVSFAVASVPAKNWFEVMLLLVYAYGGFEGALVVGGEAKNPKRDMPVALLLALLAVCAIYTAAQYVVMATLPNAGASTRPLSDAASRFLGGWGAAAIGIAALVSTYGYLSANMLHSSRITFALSKQGDFPAVLAKIHPRFRTPHVSILLYAAMVLGFAVLGNFRWNATLSAVARLAVYGAMGLAVPVLRRKLPGKAGFELPAPYLFAGASLLFAIALLSRMGRGEFVILSATLLVALANWTAVRSNQSKHLGIAPES